MNTALAFFFLALGVVLDAAHNRILRDSESRAYGNGYRQAQKEENIRTTSAAQKTAEIEQSRYSLGPCYTPPAYQMRRTTAQVRVMETAPSESKESVIPDSFWNDLQEKGRAVTHIQR